MERSEFLADVAKLRRAYGNRRGALTLALVNVRRRYVKRRRSKADALRWATAVAYAK